MPELMQTPSGPEIDGPGLMLTRVFDVLDRVGKPWCVLHGYQTYPARVPSDVDLLIPQTSLAQLLHTRRDEIGADVATWLKDGAEYVVLAARSSTASPDVLQLHASSDYSLAGRVFYRAAEILDSRRRHDTFWTPSPAIEFGCVLVNRISKLDLRSDHEKRLGELAEQDPQGCERQVNRFFNPRSARRIMRATRSGNWQAVRRTLPALRTELLSGPGARPAGGAAAAWRRRITRWLKPPCGLHVVFLGPDGVGKSTVIESVQRDLMPLFLRTTYLTFAPGLLPRRRNAAQPRGPHSLPQRSLPASLAKAAWWAVCYTAGYYVNIHSTLARAGLVINHRYLPDAIVDPIRYRYSGPKWPLRALWKVAPKPHLLFLLDPPSEVIQQRKTELAPEEIRRQRDAYRALVATLPFAHVIDASQPVNDVVADVERIMLQYLWARTARRLHTGRNR